MLKESFSDSCLWQMIARLPIKAGCEVVTLAITLYVLLRDDLVPSWAKIAIISALIYFLCPIDAIPDFLPGGFVDDVALMGGLTAELYSNVTPQAKQKISALLPKRCL